MTRALPVDAHAKIIPARAPFVLEREERARLGLYLRAGYREAARRSGLYRRNHPSLAEPSLSEIFELPRTASDRIEGNRFILVAYRPHDFLFAISKSRGRTRLEVNRNR